MDAPLLNVQGGDAVLIRADIQERFAQQAIDPSPASPTASPPSRRSRPAGRSGPGLERTPFVGSSCAGSVEA